MRRIARARRWRPAFPNTGTRGRLFFYSGARQSGAAAFFHHHHGDDRPHVHLVEAKSPAPALGHFHDGNHEELSTPSHAHRHNLHEHGRAAEPAGHWHFSFAESADRSSIPQHCFLQVLTLDWSSLAPAQKVGQWFRLNALSLGATASLTFSSARKLYRHMCESAVCPTRP